MTTFRRRSALNWTLPFVLAVAAASLAAQVPNDECAGAIPIGEGLTSASTSGATTSGAGAPSCGGIFNDVWYVYVPSCTGAAAASFCAADGGSATFFAELVAYAGACGSLTEIACGRGLFGTCGTRVSFPVAVGVPVMLRVGGVAPSYQGAFQLAVSCGPAPSNDVCANAIPLQLGMNGPFSNVGASEGPQVLFGVTFCLYLGQSSWSPGYSDVWFSWTATSTALVRFSICTTAYTVMLLHQACGSTQELACANACGLVGYPISVVPGSTYLIRVASPYSVGLPPPIVTQGSFTITITSVWALRLSAPAGPGSFSMRSFDGTPFNPYLTAATQTQGAYPGGWFYGIDVPYAELLSEWNWPGGLPFHSFLDGSGDSPPFVVPAGVPSGLTLYGVSVDIDPVTGMPVLPTAPVIFVTP